MEAVVYDAVVVGTGFGGAVAACRLAQAGFRICVLERGWRYGKNDFPRLPALPKEGQTEWNLDPARLFWSVDQGLWDVRDLGGVQIAQAAGYGGGSLVYANVHLRPPREVFGGDWPRLYRGRTELDPYFDLAAHMLRVTRISDRPGDKPLPLKALRLSEASKELGRGAQLFQPPIAITFEDTQDNGFGKPQGACTDCGNCVVGCQEHAKNTLDLNYLAEAEKYPGCSVRTLAEVTKLSRDGGAGVFKVEYHDHVLGGVPREIRAPRVFLCAGAVNSTELLLRSRDALGLAGDLPIGEKYFSNADSLGVIYDTKESHEPTKGPTITTSLLHDTGKLDWFMLQDGGYGESWDLLIALIRASVWLGANRTSGERAAKPSLEQATALARSFRRALAARPALAGARGPVKLPPIPADFIDVYRYLRARIAAEVGREVETLVGTVRENILKERAAKIGDAIGGIWPGGKPAVEKAAFSLLNGIVGGLGLDPETVTRHTKGVIRDRYEPKDLADLLLTVAGFLLFDSRPNAHTAVVLAMGRDCCAGSLHLDGTDLQASVSVREMRPIYTVEERLMRDVRNKIGGELRTNPFWSLVQRPMTVHSLGGCAMSDEGERGVVGPDGQLKGCAGVFVLDGAAIPASVGANPSATIAAIAERNIHLAIKEMGRPDWEPPGWKKAREWADGKREQLEVLDAIKGPTQPPLSKSAGITFTEKMRGYHFVGKVSPETHEESETEGRRKGTMLEVELDATIDDLADFLLDPQHEIRLSGTARFRPGDVVPAAGHLHLLPDPSKPEEREMRYFLEMGQYRLTGIKTFRDDPGFDSWGDATTLRFDVTEAAGATFSRGILRLSAAGLLEQLSTFRVVHADDDPVRKGWALLSFLRFFFGNLQRVYLRELRLS